MIKTTPRRRKTDRRFMGGLKDSIRRFIDAMMYLVIILMVGTTGYMMLEQWELLDSLWMTVITMSTVGFGEVAPMDSPARILTIVIILLTLLVGGYAVSNISAFIIGGEIGAIMRGRKLEKDLSLLNNHTILVAYGRVGKEAAHGWDQHQLVIIEKEPAAVKEAIDAGFLVVEGDATQDAILLKAGIKRAKALMIASGHTSDNVLIALTAKEFNPKIIISARGNEPGCESKLRRAGADRIVMPHQIGGRRMSAFVQTPGVADFLDLAMSTENIALQLGEFTISQASQLVGKTLLEADLRKETGGALIISVCHIDGSHDVAPSPNYKLEAGDMLITLGTPESLKSVNDLTGHSK